LIFKRLPLPQKWYTLQRRFLLKSAVYQNIPTLKGVKSLLLKFFFRKTALSGFLASILEYTRKQRYNEYSHNKLNLNTQNQNRSYIMKHIKLIPALFLALASFFTLNAQETQPTFQDFIAQFPKAELPYTFNAATLQAQLEARTATKAPRLDWEFYQFLPELERSAAFSSMPVHPQPVAAFETAQYTAVVYNLARGLARGNKTFSITVFTKTGEYIGTHFVAGVNPETLTAATINEDLTATVLEYKVNWTNNYRDNGPIGNSITGLTIVETGVFSLATAGNPDQIVWANRTASTNSTNLVEMK